MDNQLLDTDVDRPAPQYKALANFGARFGAFFLDEMITSVVGLLVLGAFGINYMDLFQAILDGAKDDVDPMDLFGAKYYMASAVTLAIRWYYFAQQESSVHQATLGKRVVGLVVTDLQNQRLSFGHASLRFLMKALPSVLGLVGAVIGAAGLVGTLSLLFWFGFFIQPFTPKKQALHDILAKTLVYQK